MRMNNSEMMAGEIVDIARQLGVVEGETSLEAAQVLMLAEVIKVKIKAAVAAKSVADELNTELRDALQLACDLSDFTGSITLRLATDDTVAALLTELRSRIDRFQQVALPALERAQGMRPGPQSS
jgi:hypothetical protein